MDIERLVRFSADPEQQENIWGYLTGLEALGLRLVEHEVDDPDDPMGTIRITDYRTGQQLGICSVSEFQHLDYTVLGWVPVEGEFQ